MPCPIFFIFSLDILFSSLFHESISIKVSCSGSSSSIKLAVLTPKSLTGLPLHKPLNRFFEMLYISVPESVAISTVICFEHFVKSLYLISTATVFAFCFPSRNLPETFSESLRIILFISTILSKSFGRVVEFPTPFKSSFWYLLRFRQFR